MVQYSTVRLLLILEVLLKLKSKQGDATATSLHGELEEGKNIYLEMPTRFKKPGKVLKLKKALYGLKQSSMSFWKYLTKAMEACGLTVSKMDPCLFVEKKVLCISYVDGIFF